MKPHKMLFINIPSSNDEKPFPSPAIIDIHRSSASSQYTPTSPRTLQNSSKLMLISRRYSYLSLLGDFIGYENDKSHKPHRSTAHLDGLRGLAALAVYIFHILSCWFSLVPAYGSSSSSTNILQLPFIRSFFIAGGAAVSVFFVLSGYVLTYRSLSSIRSGKASLVYSSVASSAFRRGFRLYLPVIALTFMEMIATRFGFPPPLNFDFRTEATLGAQIWDWILETNHLINPLYNAQRAIEGAVTHPKYEAVVWTIPLEFWGSMICYALLLILTMLRGGEKVRMALLAGCSGVCMWLGSWNMCCFSAGILIADYNLGQESSSALPSPVCLPFHKLSATLPSAREHRDSRTRPLWIAMLGIGFYLAGFPSLLQTPINPDPFNTPMPGFSTLRSLTPTTLFTHIPNADPARFWWSISGISILLSVSQLPNIKHLFESRACQYLGKISFSLYLVHQFFLVLFGLALQKVMLGFAGVEKGKSAGIEGDEGKVLYWLLCGVWLVAFTTSVLAIAARVEKWVDVPSVRFAKWLEERCLKCYHSIRLQLQ